MSKDKDHYLEVLENLLKEKVIDTSSHILVACGGTTDRNTLMRAGLNNCVISNLDSRQSADEFLPLGWSYQDAEAMSYADGAFDFCIVHEGLHHCRSPHSAMIEMLRVAKRGILIIEPAENIFTKLGVKMGFGQEYEQAAVYGNDCLFGGFQNTFIPNYLYRFSPSDIRKTLLCARPEMPLNFKFTHYLRLPWEQLRLRKNHLRLTIVSAINPILILFQRLLPGVFANQMTALVLKPTDPMKVQPWLRREGDHTQLNMEWFQERFGGNSHSEG
jgi:SAM-dependent methyltransferase